MSTCTRVTLAQFARLATAAEDVLRVDQIASLLERVAVEEARIHAMKRRLAGMLARRYGAAVRHLHDLAEETTDTITLVDGDFVVKAELPQEVTWDQKKLAKLAETIFHDWQRDPEDYINISYTVDEQSYVTWPPELREHFDEARSLGTGEPRFEVAAVKRAKPRTGVA